MAQQRLNRFDETHAALANGVDILNTNLPKLETGALQDDWVDWLVATILLREARALIKGQADSAANLSRAK
jgi:hypothetical protein